MATIKNPTTVIKSGGGSTEIVNGIIEQYKASTTTIDANTFVQFVSDMESGQDTQATTTANSYQYITAVQVDTNKVFIAHSGGNYLYGMVCTISGTTFTAGTDTQLSTVSNSRDYATAVQVDTNKVFISHRNGNYLYGMVCTISGTTITAGTDTQLSTSSSSRYTYATSVSIATNKVFVVAANAYGIVCTISGTTITAGTEKIISSSISTTGAITAVLVNTNKVFVAAFTGGSTNNYLYGAVCTISGTTFTAGTAKQILATYGLHLNASSVSTTANVAFLVYRTGNYLYGMVCTISGTTFTAGTQTLLSELALSASWIGRPILVGTNKVYITYSSSATTSLYGMVCTISGTTIKTGIDIELPTSTNSYYYPSPVLVSPNTMFIAHGRDALLYGLVFTSDFVNNIEVSTDRIDGITKTSCTTTTAGDVWTLDN